MCATFSVSICGVETRTKMFEKREAWIPSRPMHNAVLVLRPFCRPMCTLHAFCPVGVVETRGKAGKRHGAQHAPCAPASMYVALGCVLNFFFIIVPCSIMG